MKKIKTIILYSKNESGNSINNITFYYRGEGFSDYNNALENLSKCFKFCVDIYYDDLNYVEVFRDIFYSSDVVFNKILYEMQRCGWIVDSIFGHKIVVCKGFEYYLGDENIEPKITIYETKVRKI